MRKQEGKLQARHRPSKPASQHPQHVPPQLAAPEAPSKRIRFSPASPKLRSLDAEASEAQRREAAGQLRKPARRCAEVWCDQEFWDGWPG